MQPGGNIEVDQTVPMLAPWYIETIGAADDGLNETRPDQTFLPPLQGKPMQVTDQPTFWLAI